MLNIGMTEILVFGIIALLVLGPDKLPEAVRFVAQWYQKIKRMISNVQSDLDRELRISELRIQMQEEMQKIEELELKMQNQWAALQQQSPIDTAKNIKASASSTMLFQYQFISKPPINIFHFPSQARVSKLSHLALSQNIEHYKVAV